LGKKKGEHQVGKEKKGWIERPRGDEAIKLFNHASLTRGIRLKKRRTSKKGGGGGEEDGKENRPFACRRKWRLPSENLKQRMD